MTYYFEFQEYRPTDEEPHMYNNLLYEDSVHTKNYRIDYFTSKIYTTFRKALKDYHRIIIKSGQLPRPRFYYNLRRNYEYMSQGTTLYNYYVKNKK